MTGVVYCSASPQRGTCGEIPNGEWPRGRGFYGGTQWKGTDFRQKLGLNSTNFSFEINDGVLSISTIGYGHGVGLCQHGANGMAKEGYTFEEILTHYYPGCYLETQS